MRQSGEVRRALRLRSRTITSGVSCVIRFVYHRRRFRIMFSEIGGKMGKAGGRRYGVNAIFYRYYFYVKAYDVN